MYEFIVGCDVSKDTFDSAYWDKKAIYHGSFSNDVSGFEQWLTFLKEKTTSPLEKWLVVFENTGVYSKELKQLLLIQGIPCVEEHALKIKRNAPMQRGKTDPTDAKMICEYAVEKMHKLSPDKATDETIKKIRPLLARRALLVKQKTALSVSNSESKRGMPGDVQVHLEALHSELYVMITSQIKEIEKLIKTFIDQDEDVKRNFKLATSVVGVGMITGAFMLCHTNNFSKNFNARKFACFSGVAPFPNQSGKRTGKKKVSSKGNKVMKAMISNCVTSAVQHDPFFRGYYERLLQKNKPPGVIKNNIKNKLIARVFAAVKRQTPYVKLAYS